jgi:hypothetical protein
MAKEVRLEDWIHQDLTHHCWFEDGVSQVNRNAVAIKMKRMNGSIKVPQSILAAITIYVRLGNL